MSKVRQRASTGRGRETPSASGAEPLQDSLTDGLVQADTGLVSDHAGARAAVSGPGGRLPHLDVIQESFGPFDVTDTVAHTDTNAARGTAATGAAGATVDGEVALGAGADLHTAAHEAAHVVQQRGGVQLAGGTGTVGDVYERNADAVADRVVAGEPAHDLLAPYAGSGAARGVQFAKVDVATGLREDGATRVITGIVFNVNRMAFAAATKRILNKEFPAFAKGATTLKDGYDRRHWESNEMIKQEIIRMFVGQPFNEVAEHLVSGGFSRRIASESDLQAALYRYWKSRFSEVGNLRVEDAAANQALGRLIGVLKPHVERGQDAFEPLSVSMAAYGMEERVEINSWEDLMEWYYNANFDFTYGTDMAAEMMEAEMLFAFALKYAVPSKGPIDKGGPSGGPPPPSSGASGMVK